MAQFKTCENILKKELDIAPGNKTINLYHTIKDGSFFNGGVTDNESFHSLPKPTTPFIGRKKEIKTIHTCLKDPRCRLITLTGGGGLGKTQLALRAARLLSTHFPNGIYFIPLSDIPAENPQSILTLFAKLLFPNYQKTHLSWNTISYFIGNKEILLILDNFEHLLKEGTRISTLLGETLRLKMLVTSRFRLMLESEYIIRISGLSYPAQDSMYDASFMKDENNNRKITTAQEFSAITLFYQTGKKVQSDFAPAPTTLPTVVSICHLMDGMPLAIILAASWLDIFPPDKILLNLNAQLDFFKTEFQCKFQPGNYLPIIMTSRIILGVPCFFSDGFSSYYNAIIEFYRKLKVFPRTGKRGCPKKTVKEPHPDLVYGQIVKERKGSRIVRITYKVKCSTKRLKQLGLRISTTLLERLNLTMRQSLSPYRHWFEKLLVLAKREKIYENKQSFFRYSTILLDLI